MLAGAECSLRLTWSGDWPAPAITLLTLRVTGAFGMFFYVVGVWEARHPSHIEIIISSTIPESTVLLCDGPRLLLRLARRLLYRNKGVKSVQWLKAQTQRTASLVLTGALQSR